MADTIVQYILNVDTDRAEKGLRDTSQEAKQTSTQFDRVAASSTGLNSGLKRTERQVVSTTKRFRQMRRAGRDLDGAFSDLGQGLSIVSPAAGNLFMTLSDGASIAEGLGRSLTLFVNPAFVAVAGVTALAAGALFLYQREQKKAEEEAKEFRETIERSNKTVKEQQAVIDRAQTSLSTYATKLQDAQMGLDVLTGALSQFELAQIRATQAAADFQSGAESQNRKILDGLFTQIQAEQAKLFILDEQANRLVEQEAAILAQGGSLSRTAEIALENAQTQRELVASLAAQFKTQQGVTSEIEQQSQELEDILNKQAEIRREREEAAEAERKRAEEERKRREEERKAREAQIARDKAANDRLNRAQTARNQLQKISGDLDDKQLSDRELILKKFRDQRSIIRQLAAQSGEIELGREIENKLLEDTKRLLGEINNEEKIRSSQLERQATIISSIQSSIGALQSPEALVGSLGSILEGTGALVGGETGAGLAEFGASPELALATSVVQSVAGLGSSVQSAIDEAAADGITLNEEQARRVVLGNMDQAFQNFTRDLERGLALLPQIVIDILPEFIVTLTKVLTVDLQRFIAIDLPIALIRAIPEIVIAVINEIGFLLADLINGFRTALDQFSAFLQSVLTREGRRDARADALEGLKDFFRSEFGGVQAFGEALRGFAGGGAFIPQAQGGMRFTGSSRSGLAMLHQNEFVVPASGQRPQTVDRQMSSMGGGVNIVINSPVVEQNAVDALVRRIEERFNSNFGLSSSNLFGGR